MPPRNFGNRNPGIQCLNDDPPLLLRRPPPAASHSGAYLLRPNATFVSHIVSVICAKPSRQISEKSASSRAPASRWYRKTADYREPSMTIDEFLAVERISRSSYYKMRSTARNSLIVIDGSR